MTPARFSRARRRWRRKRGAPGSSATAHLSKEKSGCILDLFSIGKAIAAFDGRLGHEFDSVATDIQRSLLQIAAPEIPGLEIGLHASPGRLVSGDYLDVIPRGGATPVVGIGELSGRSLPAALKSLSFKFAARGVFAAGITDFARALECLNDVMCDSLIDDEYASALFFSAAPDGHGLSLANAGHDPPIVYRARTGLVEETPGDGLVLGVARGMTYGLRDVPLEPGDAVVFYTDGFTDARNASGEPFTLERVKAGLQHFRELRSQALANALFEQIETYTLGTYRDEASVIVVRSL